MLSCVRSCADIFMQNILAVFQFTGSEPRSSIGWKIFVSGSRRRPAQAWRRTDSPKSVTTVIGPVEAEPSVSAALSAFSLQLCVVRLTDEGSVESMPDQHPKMIPPPAWVPTQTLSGIPSRMCLGIRRPLPAQLSSAQVGEVSQRIGWQFIESGFPVATRSEVGHPIHDLVRCPPRMCESHAITFPWSVVSVQQKRVGKKHCFGLVIERREAS